MKDFNFIIPQNCQFGIGSLKKLPELLAECGSDNVMLVSDHSLEEIGLVAKVRKVIEDAGIKYSEFLDIYPNPTVAMVDAAAEVYKKAGATSMLALGGGSPMDVAKSVGVIAKFGGSITDYEGVGKVPGNIDPLIAIPTTAGTGSEVTVAAVIVDEERHYKLSVLGNEISPRYALLDPELIMTAPASVAAACGVDALIHAMSHPVSAFFNVPHGVANAVLMPTIFEFNALADEGKYAKIYQYITGKKAGDDFVPQDLVKALKELNNDLGIAPCLADVGVTEDKIPQMSEDAMKSGNVAVNPRATRLKDIEELYRKAMYK